MVGWFEGKSCMAFRSPRYRFVTSYTGYNGRLELFIALNHRATANNETMSRHNEVIRQ